MKIEKFKRNRNGSYTLFLENQEELTVYEEVILKYELLLSKKLDDKKKETILLENAFWETYYQGLKVIEKRAKTKKELKEDLKKKGYLPENIDQTIQKLEEQKYLDDLRYADSYVNNQMLTTSWGPLKIKNMLLQKGVEEDLVNQALLAYTEELEREKLEKKVTKMITSNRTKSPTFLKQKIKQTTLSEGYHFNILQEVLENVSFQDDKALREREYNKLKRRLERKYSGEELERQIKMKLYQKGFTNQNE